MIRHVASRRGGRPGRAVRRLRASVSTSSVHRPTCRGPAAEAWRIERAVAMLDRLDVARHLLRLEPACSRLALALQLLEQTADDIAELAGMP